MNRLPFSEKTYSGVLVVAEGAMRSGKSTFLRQLSAAWPDALFVEWNSYPIFRTAVGTLKQRRELNPLSHCLVSIADYAMTFANVAMPALSSGRVVLSDRYLYTSYARDLPRGVPERLLDELCRHFPRPDITCYFEAPRDVMMSRYRETPDIYGPYATGADLWPDLPAEHALERYYEAQVEVYHRLAHGNDFVMTDHRRQVERVVRERHRRVPPSQPPTHPR